MNKKTQTKTKATASKKSTAKKKPKRWVIVQEAGCANLVGRLE